jgi:hypothetical protein
MDKNININSREEKTNYHNSIMILIKKQLQNKKSTQKHKKIIL